jgi:adenine-specific DNA-methyltransferase
MGTKEQRGQFFTTNADVQTVLGQLITHRSGSFLEPSAGPGHLVKWAEDNLPNLSIEAVELDSALTPVCQTKILYQDFFTFANNREVDYDVILGNPPFVAWKSVEESTRASASDVKGSYADKTNLYHLFMDRCIDLLKPGGELIFIVPKEWLYTSSAEPLRHKMTSQGSITHLIDCGEEKLFTDASVPALLIFRFVKGQTSNSVQFASSLADAKSHLYSQQVLYNIEGRFLLLDPMMSKLIAGWGTLKESYRVRVGMVSGADNIFRVPPSLVLEPECVLDYVTTKGVERFIDVNHISEWSQMPPLTAAYLLSQKQALLARRIVEFNESNFWRYGAVRNHSYMIGNVPRFYAFAKTRLDHPFFMNDSTHMYSGGILGLFQEPRTSLSRELAMEVLNSKRYRAILEAMFLCTGNKVSLQPATLEDAPFPRTAEQAQDWLSLTDEA